MNKHSIIMTSTYRFIAKLLLAMSLLVLVTHTVHITSHNEALSQADHEIGCHFCQQAFDNQEPKQPLPIAIAISEFPLKLQKICSPLVSFSFLKPKLRAPPLD